MDSGVILAALGQILGRLPTLIAWLVAVVIALVRWKKHPKVSALVVIAVAILSIELLIGSVFTAAMPRYLSASGRGASEIGVVFAAYSFVNSAISAGCWAMLIAAIFGWREQPPS